jgi:catechol 2,3-dioxygenase-like lactoylglutathione lyase family enzyme
MNNPITVEHIGLAAKDTTQLKDWYVQKLGAEILFQMPQNPPAYLVRLGGMIIEIYNAAICDAQVGDNQVGGWRHLALKVDSLPKAKEWLSSRGVQFSEEVKPAGGGGKVLFFRDAEGNLLHLVERLPGGYQ